MDLHANVTEGFLDSLFVSLNNGISGHQYNPWYGSVIGSIIVGLSGIFPLLVLPVDGSFDKNEGSGERLKLMLSFAVGGLLGDVFLHLLPQAWSYQSKLSSLNGTSSHSFCGGWVLVGLLVFILVEKLFPKKNPEEVLAIQNKKESTNNNVSKEGTELQSKAVSGYLNLMANVIDNFTHGLAVGGSFLLSWRVGIFTTAAILIHEVPHEIGDFAILLRAGFSRLDATKAQLATASSSLIGACTAVAFSSASHLIEQKTSWILPFTSGGFLHIALVTVLPELVEEENPKESLKQIFFLVLGIAVMGFLSHVIEE